METIYASMDQASEANKEKLTADASLADAFDDDGVQLQNGKRLPPQ